jgi:DnaJ-class molecular chaperone
VSDPIFSAYRTLGIHRQNTDDEIKAAYRILCMKLHPDRDSGNMAEFIKVQEAYAALKGVAPLQRINRMQILGTGCPACSTVGVKVTQKRFVTVGKSACTECGGAGYLPLEDLP